MIRVDRGAEPASLRAARAWRLARAVVARRAGDDVDFADYGTDEVRRLLYDRQHEKCAYCEMPLQDVGQPIEHFRPKNYAVRAVTEAGPRDDDRYWWLAWTWDNLFFACVSCNSTGRKGNRFPLAPGAPACAEGPASARLAPSVPRDERAQFVDPGFDDPLDHIEFVREGDDWKPTGRAGDERGRDTVNGLHLDDRQGLLGKYTDHIELIVEPKLAPIRAAIEAGNRATLATKWHEAMASLLISRRAPFRALSFDVIAAEFPADVRDEYGLTLHRPGAPPPAEGAPINDAPPALHALPDDVIWAVRAIGPARSARYGEHRDAAVEALCAHTPRTVDELVSLTGRSREVIDTALAGLVSGGRVEHRDDRFGTPGSLDDGG